MEFKRSDRASAEVRAIVSELLLKKINDPRIGFCTITRVKAADDLRNMTVYASIRGDEATKKRSLEGLRSAVPFFEREVFKRLGIKVPTALIFRLDESLEKGAEIQELIKKAVAEDAA